MEDKKPKEKKVEVMAQLPTQNIRSFIDDQGIEHEILTIEEAIKEILENTRKIVKSVG